MIHTPRRQPVRQIIQRHKHDCAIATGSTAETLARRGYDLLVEISVPPPTSFPRRERRRGGRPAKTARPVLRAALRYGPPAYRRADPTPGAQSLVSYLVRTTPPG